MRSRTGPMIVALATSLAFAACTGDDDAAPSSTAVVVETVATVESTLPPPTDPPTTLPPETTSAPSTAAPPTTVDLIALKAQIATDYQRSWQLRRELVMAPALDGLDSRIAQISAPGSDDAAVLRTTVEELVSTGDRTIPGDPDVFDIDIEAVELRGDPPTEASVTVCFVSNVQRVDREGNVLSGGLIAARRQETVVPTDNGWLPTAGVTVLWQGVGVTECLPA